VIETGHICYGGTGDRADVCEEICGDGQDWRDFECDDGNRNELDGCNFYCEVEVGWLCNTGLPGVGGGTGTADNCFNLCGDGRRVSVEGCDDANNANGDGCDGTCVIENGW